MSYEDKEKKIEAFVTLLNRLYSDYPCSVSDVISSVTAFLGSNIVTYLNKSEGLELVEQFKTELRKTYEGIESRGVPKRDTQAEGENP